MTLRFWIGSTLHYLLGHTDKHQAIESPVQRRVSFSYLTSAEGQVGQAVEFFWVPFWALQ